MTATTAATRRPRQRSLRADAQRNREVLLTEANATFAAHGTDASLDEIARRARVGIGTLYRHFPTRRALLEAVLADSIEALCVDAERLSDTASPGDALVTWLHAVVAHAATYRGLAAEVLCTSGQPGATSCASCDAMRAAGARLLTRAQVAGAVRPDVDAEDLFTIVNGIAWSTEQTSAGSDRRERLLAMMLDGMRLG